MEEFYHKLDLTKPYRLLDEPFDPTGWEDAEPYTLLDESDDSARPEPEKQHECPKCHKIFTNWSKFRRHFRRHGRKDLDCPMCGKHFDRPYALRKHVNSKFTHVTYPCPQCDQVSKTVKEARRHRRVHSKYKHRTGQFACSQCSEVYDTSKGLASHRPCNVFSVLIATRPTRAYAAWPFTERRRTKTRSHDTYQLRYMRIYPLPKGV